MADIIKLLPDSISNHIAAGEVIQRPSSAVKELLENAIDAGASDIKLIIKEAGKTLVQVVDNGCGMSETDARLCFEKHATSKINDLQDLFFIRTKGFRGEALASIAAVGEVELKTRRSADEIGTCIRIAGTEVLEQVPCSCPVGTSLSMKNLFFNVPARRNFLKSDNVEFRHIVEEFQRIALAHPQVCFSFVSDSETLFKFIKGGMRQRIIHVFGNNYNERIVPVDEASDIISIRGYIGKTQYSKKTRGDQYFFVNNRFIKSSYLNNAVKKAYENLIPKNNYPFYILYIDVDPSSIDINVHPTKQEIQFDDEKLVYAFVNSGVKHALASHHVTPTLDFEQEKSLSNFDSFIRPHFDTKNIHVETTNQSTIKHHRPRLGQSNQPDWQTLYQTQEDIPAQTVTIPSKWEEQTPLSNQEEEPTKTQEKEPSKSFQIHQKFIVSPIKSGFIFIDQQLAHERICYERYIQQLAHSHIAAQKELFPKTIHLSTQDALIMEEVIEDIRMLGFDIHPFGQNSYVIQGLPADMVEQKDDEQSLMEEIIEEYKRNKQIGTLNKRDRLARSMAKRTCIKSGSLLNQEEIEPFINQLFACENPYYAPDGKRTFIQFDFPDLEKKFQNK